MNQERQQNSTTIIKGLLFIAFIFCAFISVVPKAHAAYGYYRTITVTSTNTVASGTNSNFPMLVSSTVTSWESSSHGGHIQNLTTAPNGNQEPADLVFATSSANCNSTPLNFETETYVSSTGALVDWVNVPSESAGTVIYACYGNSSVTTDQSHPSSTWNSNYVGVWHMGNASSPAKDSSKNGISLSQVNTPTFGAAGKIGNAVTTITSSDSYLNNSSSISNLTLINSPLTLSMWVKSNATLGAGERLAEADSSASGAWGLSVAGSTNPHTLRFTKDNTTVSSVNGTITDSTWTYVVATRDGTDVRFYFQGVKTDTIAQTYPSTVATYFSVGCLSAVTTCAAAQTFPGTIDEVRVSSVALSDSWILTEYNNQNSPSTFYTMGSETSLAPHATSVSTTTLYGGVSGNSITITGTNFGTVTNSNSATCNGGVGTGCVEFIVGGTATVASASITSWSNTSITFTISPTLASNGGVGALQVWAANASDTSPATFYIYPNITAVTALGTNAAREYSASDTDGLIMLSGDHFGTSGTSTILGSTATQYGSVAGPCTVGGYTSTSVCLEVPTSIANNNYSGTVILNRSSDNMQATTSLSILPRITAINPSSTAVGTVMQILGNHFCQTGTCPTTPNRSSTTNNITLGGGSGYSYYRAITVTSTTSIASGTNTNFPMLFSGTYSWLEASSSGGRIQNLVTAPNGGQEPADLVFSSNSGCTSPLNYETESYSSSTGAINDWINVSSLSAGTVIYACYGNSSVTTDQSHPSSTWNSNYAAVYHFASASSTIDSTANANYLEPDTIHSGVAPSSTSSGQIDGANTFNGTSQYWMSSNNLDYTSASTTFEAWVYPTNLNGTYQELIRNGNTFLLINSDNQLCYTSQGGQYGNPDCPNATANTWQFVVGTNDGTNTRIYVNGALEATYAEGAATENTNFGIGSLGGSEAQLFIGTMDEARIAMSALSPSWILTEYNNQNSPSTFYTLGSETSGGGASSSTVPDSSFLNETGGAGVCNGSGAAWSDGEMCATIPLSAPTGTIGTTIISNGNISNSYSFNILIAVPGAPGTPSYSSVASSTLTVSWTAPSGGATYYSLARATSSNGTYAQVTTTTGLSYGDSGLTPSTSYWYEVRGVNSTGNGSYSATSTVTTSVNYTAPNAASQDAPGNATQNISTSPTFLMEASSTDTEPLEYKVVIYSSSGCSSGVVQTDDETASQTGWSGQNASSSQEYTSGTEAAFTVQSALSQSTQYYWQASAKDPDGSNTWTSSGVCNSFTTTSGNWTTDSGSWSISSNKLVVTPGSGNYVQLHVTGQSITNDVVEFKVTASGGSAGDTSAIFRADSGSNRYSLGDADYVDQLHRIGKTISSSYSTLTSASLTLSASTVYDARGYANGTALQSWINGGTALSTTDSALSSSGFIGLGASGNNTFTYTDFAIYTSPTITLSSLPSGGSWSVLDHTGTAINCNTGSTWSVSTYTGQVPIDYDNGGGSVAVWTNGTCSGAAAATYPSSGLATDIFGGDTYLYTPAGSTGGGTTGNVAASTTITISSVGLVSD